MIHSVFHLDVPVAEKVLRAALIYVFLVVALRKAGKRELAQLSTVDFIVLLMVANAVQNGIQGDDLSVTGNVVSASTLLALNSAVASVLSRSARGRAVVEGTGMVLIDGGVVCQATCHRQRISREDLLVAIQRLGAQSVAEVDRAVLEPGGAMVITRGAASAEQQLLVALSVKLDALEAAVDALLAAARSPQGPA